MNKYIKFVFALFIFASCEDVVEIDVKKQEKDLYCVEAKITTQSEPWVFVSKSMSVTVDEPFKGISNLVVTLTDDAQPANTITLVEDDTKKGYYKVPDNSSYLGITGRTYTLSILTPENLTLTATETLFRVEPIDSILVMPSERGEYMFLGIFTYGKEPEGIGNYYKWDIYINDTLLTIDHVPYLVFASDEQVDGNPVLGLEIFTDYHDPNIEEERLLKLNDTIYVEQTSITEFAYNFYLQMDNQASAGDMFSVPPANIPGNFTSSNGEKVLGLFTAHDISRSDTVVIDSIIDAQLDDK